MDFHTAVYVGHCLINTNARDAMVRVIGTHGCRALLDTVDIALHAHVPTERGARSSLAALIRELAFAESYLLK